MDVLKVCEAACMASRCGWVRRCLRFQADAQFEHRNHVGHGSEVLCRDFEVSAGIGWAYEGANAMPGFDQPASLQPRQSLAHYCAADVKAQHDFGLGCQLVARFGARGPNVFTQARDNLIDQTARTPYACHDKGIRVRHSVARRARGIP